MSYLVLARKYRPRTFAEMVGQEHVVRALGNSLTQQRLHHAYLFTGTRGIGKTTVSRVLAKSLNCTGPDGSGGITASPCGQCPACRDIDAGRYVDYVELDAASNRGVDEISQLLDQSVYKPVAGRFKVYMIDEVHMLTNTAFNAMLKTLEEPPEYLKFVLATTDPQKVPVTVLSRCLQFNLRPMATETVREHLAHVLQAEGIEAEPGALTVIARSARGSMRDALSLTDQAIAFGAGRIEEAPVRQMLGAVDRTHVIRIVDAVADGDAGALVAVADDLRGLGLSAVGVLDELASVAQDMAVAQALAQPVSGPGGAAADEGGDDSDARTIARLAARLSPDETQLVYSLALHGRGELGLAPDEYSGLVMVLLRMVAFRPEGRAARAGAAAGSAAASGAPEARRDLSRDPPRAVAKVEPRAPARSESRIDTHRAPAATPSESARAASAARPASDPSTSPMVSAATASTAASAPASALGSTSSSAPSTAAASARPAAAVAAVAPARVPEAASADAPRLDDPLTTRWVELLSRLTERGALVGLVRELAWQAQCTAIDEDAERPSWRLRIERDTLRQDAHRERLESALADLMGRPVRIELEGGAVVDSAARRDAVAKALAQARAEQIIQADPVVQSVLEQFKTARIVPGSIRPA